MLKRALIVLFGFIFYSSIVFAALTDVQQDSSTNNNVFTDDSSAVSGSQGDDSNEIENLQTEITNLNEELNNLKAKLQKTEDENNDLKSYIDKSKLQQNASQNTQESQDKMDKSVLYSEANVLKFNISAMAPTSYVKGHNALISENIDLAKTSFSAFLGEQTDVNSSTATNSKYTDYAIYWLARINTINGNYKDSINALTKLYKTTKEKELGLYIMIALTEDFTRLMMHDEACLSLNQFDSDYAAYQGKDKDNSINSVYTDKVEKLLSVNQCQ